MVKIKGWKKNTENSWIRDNDSMIISYKYNYSGNRLKSYYNVMVGRDIQTIEAIDSVGTKEEVLSRINHWMKAHPVGFQGELIKTYNPKDNIKESNLVKDKWCSKSHCPDCGYNQNGVCAWDEIKKRFK